MPERSLGPGKLRRLRTGGGVAFQADYTDSSGRRRRIHCGHDARTADRIFRKLIADRDLEVAGLGGERGLDLPVAEVVERYLSELALRARPRVLAEASRVLERIVAELGAVRLRDVTKARVVDWRLRRSREGAANKTINNGVAVLAAAINLAVELDQIAASPLAGLRALPVTAAHRRRRPRALTEEELGRLLRAAGRHDAKHAGSPQAPLLTFLLATGARWSEAIAVRWADIELERSMVTLRSETTKSKRARAIPLQGVVVETLRALRALDLSSADSPAFRMPHGRAWSSGGRVQFRRYLHRLLKAAGIEVRDSAGRVACIHSFRHGFATRLARARVPITTAKLLTGHSTTAMLTDVYTHAGDDDARAAIESLPPLGDCSESTD